MHEQVGTDAGVVPDPESSSSALGAEFSTILPQQGDEDRRGILTVKDNTGREGQEDIKAQFRILRRDPVINEGGRQLRSSNKEFAEDVAAARPIMSVRPAALVFCVKYLHKLTAEALMIVL